MQENFQEHIQSYIWLKSTAVTVYNSANEGTAMKEEQIDEDRQTIKRNVWEKYSPHRGVKYAIIVDSAKKKREKGGSLVISSFVKEDCLSVCKLSRNVPSWLESRTSATRWKRNAGKLDTNTQRKWVESTVLFSQWYFSDRQEALKYLLVINMSRAWRNWNDGANCEL